LLLSLCRQRPCIRVYVGYCFILCGALLYASLLNGATIALCQVG
jgi:hypothetical protein